MVNAQLLDDKINESGLRSEYIYKNLGLSRASFSKRKKGNTPFKVAEIYVLSDILNLSEEEKKKIFFADEVN